MEPVASVSEAVSVALKLIEKIPRGEASSVYGRPVALEGTFGTWFRGLANASWKLTPSVFRETTQGFLDEGNLFQHFQLLAPEHHQTHRSAFDWLCLMQHYDLPTRLLDWTENLLAAIYFAALDYETAPGIEKQNGKVYILAPRILNRTSMPEGNHAERGVYVPRSFHVGARATLAFCARDAQWANELRVLEHLRSSTDAERVDEFTGREEHFKAKRVEHFTRPIAVFPNRLNRRLIAQAGAFTIHGGKYSRLESFPEPLSLEALSSEAAEDQKFLWSFEIDKNKKHKIVRELMMLGIHQGTLFPELDKQAEHLKRVWDPGGLGSLDAEAAK